MVGEGQLVRMATSLEEECVGGLLDQHFGLRYRICTISYWWNVLNDVRVIMRYPVVRPELQMT